MLFDLNTISDSDIVSLCHSPNVMISGHPDSRGLAKISDDVVVKCGWSITAEEAANQEFAYNHSYGCGLKVPKVHRYFRIDNVGYIVMEFIHGICLDKVPFHEHDGLTERLAREIHHFFEQMPATDAPGPRNGGIPRGYLFSEDGAGTTLETMAKLNQWLNKRALLDEDKDEKGFNFQLSDCKFCHLDLARRNIIKCLDGSFYLIDWEHAGVYPQVFETYCLLFNRLHDCAFSQELSVALERVSPTTKPQDESDYVIKMLDRVFANNMRYCFSSPEKIREANEKLFASYGSSKLLSSTYRIVPAAPAPPAPPVPPA